MTREEFQAKLPIKMISSWGIMGPCQASLEIGKQFGLTIEDSASIGDYPIDKINGALLGADGLLLLNRGTPGALAKLWLRAAKAVHKPMMIANPKDYNQIPKIVQWIKERSITKLAIGGPDEERHRGIYSESLYYIASIFNALVGLNIMMPSANRKPSVEGSIMSEFAQISKER